MPRTGGGVKRPIGFIRCQHVLLCRHWAGHHRDRKADLRIGLSEAKSASSGHHAYFAYPSETRKYGGGGGKGPFPMGPPPMGHMGAIGGIGGHQKNSHFHSRRIPAPFFTFSVALVLVAGIVALALPFHETGIFPRPTIKILVVT